MILFRNNNQEGILALESKYKKELRSEIEEQKAIHIEELSSMLTEFQTARDYFQLEISKRDERLKEAAEKYLNRESRPDDLKLMESLRKEITGLESNAQSLQVF